jgi:hypothetical protein
MEDSSKKQNINDQAYTNYAIFIRLDSYIKESENLHKSIDLKIDEIIKAQKYTNGNVMDLLLWRAYTKGQIWIIPLVVGSIISGVVALLFKQF